MKKAANTSAIGNTVNNALATAIATITDNAPTVIRKADVVGSFVMFDDDDKATLKAGSKLTALEIGELCADYANKAASATVRACNVLSLAHMLPPVETPRADGKGTYQRKAFDIASEYAKGRCKTVSAWNNVQGMFRSIQVGEKLKLNPFKVKNGLGYLNAMNFLNDDGTLKESAKSDAGVLALMDKTVGNNALVDKLGEVKKRHNEAAKADGKPVPFPAVESKAEREAQAKLEAEKAKSNDTADAINREVVSVIGRVQNMFDNLPTDGGAAKAREAIRAILREKVNALALLVNGK